MCGIAGWYRRGGRPVSAAVVTAQCDSIRHRGPDDSGVMVDGDFGFGMRRLSIVDIVGGHQPMATSDGRRRLVMNGEIYNHRRLRPALEAAGYAFRSESDTETALAAWAVWGDAAWPRLEGMFAIAAWDAGSRSLTLVRDPLGIKPLYITEQAGGLAFASELKALTRLPDHRFDPDDRAVDDLFSFGHVRRPRSIYRQVRVLDPGTSLTLQAEGAGQGQTYWRPRLRPRHDLSEGEWIEQARHVIDGAVRDHLLSDVPVGAFLSGGIDSGTVTAAMVRAGAGAVKAFTIGYPGARIDETAAAREIAQHLGCEHIVRPVELQEAAHILPRVQQAYDEPFADPAAVPNWYASQVAAEHVKVVLCGEGGDELFAGYKRHRNAHLINKLRPLLDRARPLAGLVAGLPRTGSSRLNYLRQQAGRFDAYLGLGDGYPQFFAATQISSLAERQALYSDRFAAQTGERTLKALEREYFAASAPRGDPLQEFLFADLSLNLPSAMLTRLDRASMAHSLEARVPFLSHVVVDWALSVPLEMKIRGSVGKYILRKAAEPWLPAATFKRPKQGFQMPLAAWFRGGLGRYAEGVWNDSGAAGADYLDPEAVARLFAEHRGGLANHARLLYAIAVFSLWWADERGRTARPAWAA